MQQIKLKRGLDIPFEGRAAETIGSVRRPAVYHIVPDHFAGIKPKLLVKEGDLVKAGSPLFHDKKFEEMFFTSPVSGKVAAIVRGDRRKVMSIDIEADETIAYQTFDKTQDPKGLLLYSGLWSLIKQRPYDCIALPNKTPKAVFISTFDTAPAAPNYEWVLKGQLTDLQAAVSKLATIAPVYVGIQAGAKAIEFRELKDCTLFEVAGPHPAGNVGVQINNIRPICKGETVWTVSMQMLAAIGKLFNSGRYDVSRKVAITGPMALETAYVKTVPGMPMSAIQGFYGNDAEEIRFVSGDALSGANVGAEGYLRFQDNQVTLLREGNEYEAFGWANPLRFKQFSSSHTYFHWLLKLLCPKKEYALDTNLHGGERAFVVSDVYGKVLPMSIFPVYLVKACLAGDIDKMEKFGIYEVLEEDLALCEYVCPSKIDIQAIIAKGIDTMIKEMA